ncbi:hypothetical protein BJY54_006008 [Streptomyces nodosus]|nr:hypothetical protein [Streptomyces nodosus]
MTEHLYAYNETASSSIPAHWRNQEASPTFRVRLIVAAPRTRAATGPKASSDRLTRSFDGKRFPCSTLAMYAGE